MFKKETQSALPAFPGAQKKPTWQFVNTSEDSSLPEQTAPHRRPRPYARTPLDVRCDRHPRARAPRAPPARGCAPPSFARARPRGVPPTSNRRPSPPRRARSSRRRWQRPPRPRPWTPRCVDRVRGQVHRPQPPALPARHRRRGRDIRDRPCAFREGPGLPLVQKGRTRARPSRLARSPRGRSTARSQRTTPPSSSISTRRMAAASHSPASGTASASRSRMGTSGRKLSPTASPPPARRYHKSNNAGASYDMATASSTARLTMDYGLH